MKLTKKLEAEILKVYNTYCDAYLKGDTRTLASLFDDNIQIIGSSEKEVFKNKKEAVKFYEATAGHLAGLTEFRNRQISLMAVGDSVLITEKLDFYFLIKGNWIFFGPGRLSTLIDNKKDKWKLVHQHSSLPGLSPDEAGEINIKELKAENIQLHKAVKKHTIELQQKNRELEIETALERVRTVAMAMRKSSELITVCEVMYKALQDLGFTNIRNAQIAVKNDDHQLYMVTEYSDQVSITMREAPYNSSPIVQALYEELEKSSDALYQREFSGKEFEDWRKWRRSLGTENDPRIDSAHSMCFYLYSIGIGHLGISTFNPISKEQVGILKQFRNVFELSYRRYMDVALAETQAREAQIETALEKIRSRTMAMQSSNELAETASVLFKQLINLGIKPAQMRTCAIVTLRADQPIGEGWITNPSGEIIAQPFTVSYDEGSVYNKTIYAAWKRGEKFHVVHLFGEELKKHLNYLQKTAGIPTQQFQPSDDQPSETFTHALFFSQGYLLVISSEPLPEFHEIFRRVGAVFQQTYMRFLDLQKAEAQARDAQIEAALERVRTKAMAMHKSEDLSLAVAAVFDELDKLSLGISRCGIGILDKEKCSADVWTTTVSDHGKTVQVTGEEPMDIHPLLLGAFNSWLAQVDFSYTLQGKELVDYYKAMVSTNFKLPESQLILSHSDEKQYYHVAILEAGGLFAFRDTEFTEESKLILKRFAGVFNLTYKRFLDIQRAEGQAREARIEAALERVRSRSMAMHVSDDMQEVIRIIALQLSALGIKFDHVSFAKIHSDGSWDLWISTPDQPYQPQIYVPRIDHRIFNSLNETLDQGMDFIAETYDFEEKNEFFRHLFENTTAKDIPDERKNFVFKGKGMARSVFLTKNIWLNVANYSIIPYTGEENAILKRFAIVFDQSYTRFLDLQKAEAQARESQIEASMEKVRARAMTMQKPAELIEVAELLRKEMGLLGVEELETSSIYILNDAFGSVECWYAIQDIREENKKLVTDQMTIDLKDTWVGMEMLKFYISNEKQTSIIMQGEQRKEWINYCAQQSTVLEGYYGEVIPERTYHLLKFSNGYMGAASPGPISGESWELLKRATNVFSLAYTRFNDLKLAEASAKEAIKQAALDRIRAEIASMRTVNDLDRITPLIWNELTILGVPFIRCGVFIMDESQELIHTFLSTPDGKAIAAFHIPYTTPGNIERVLNHWRNKKNYIDHWDESQFSVFASTLAGEGALDSPEQYLKTIPKGGFYLHFLPFLQGMIYVGNKEQLAESQIGLVQSLAQAFSTAYARYEDFNKLEAAKQQVDKTLVDLKQAQTLLVQSEKMASLGELTAGIAHEIQNPLNFVNNFSDVSNELLEEMKTEMKKGNKDDALAIADDVIQNLGKILHHGKRADAIVKGMLQHSRSSTGQRELTDINALADEYLRLAYHGFRSKDKLLTAGKTGFNTSIQTDFDQNIEKINIIPQDIGRVLLNLYNNAFYAAAQALLLPEREAPLPPKGGFDETNYKHEPTIWVSTKRVGNKVLISVRDNGPGIPQKILDKIFQPFFTTKPTGQGTGLGLSLSYDIVKAHNGELTVESKEGEGATFIIQLPV